jgi:2-C-methyl-D-erythritol 4-phosphate cytidylyltransferase/2-C-methyl-D-erythritol 2,4-cyclodiphosphate synthase
MRVVAIIAAGGLGTRLGAGTPKQFLDLGGRSVLDRSVTAFVDHPAVTEVVVALPAGAVDAPPAFLRDRQKPVRIVRGGERRQDSVARAFALVSNAEIVLVHDAARPLVDAGTITRTIEQAARSGAAIAAVPARDTVKLAEASGGSPPRVSRTIPREQVWMAQTPQAFRRDVLRAAVALGAGGATGTDEAALAEQAGFEVALVEGTPANIKITTADDLAMARRSLAMREAAAATAVRIGIGYDSHRFADGRPLVLGGVVVPHERGLAGHSDADAVCHALTDAVLGAAALGDIGRHFPDTDPRWKDADSLALLAEAARLARDAGFAVANVDVVVIAEQPKLTPYVDAMRERIAAALRVTTAVVSIKGKTNEGMGETGRGEGLAVHAVALLRTAPDAPEHLTHPSTRRT